MARDVSERELIEAARNAVRWLGKAVADDAFAGCTNPTQARVDLLRLEAVLSQVSA